MIPNSFHVWSPEWPGRGVIVKVKRLDEHHPAWVRGQLQKLDISFGVKQNHLGSFGLAQKRGKPSIPQTRTWGRCGSGRAVATRLATVDLMTSRPAWPKCHWDGQIQMLQMWSKAFFGGRSCLSGTPQFRPIIITHDHLKAGWFDCVLLEELGPKSVFEARSLTIHPFRFWMILDSLQNQSWDFARLCNLSSHIAQVEASAAKNLDPTRSWVPRTRAGCEGCGVALMTTSRF